MAMINKEISMRTEVRAEINAICAKCGNELHIVMIRQPGSGYDGTQLKFQVKIAPCSECNAGQI
jgi:ssDNA-binding Zn-finger/Zn-ribbon topoisomerase 1